MEELNGTPLLNLLSMSDAIVSDYTSVASSCTQQHVMEYWWESLLLLPYQQHSPLGQYNKIGGIAFGVALIERIKELHIYAVFYALILFLET